MKDEVVAYLILF